VTAAQRTEILAPVVAALQTCKQSADLAPENCPQQVSQPGASGVVWHLYGDPGAGAEISGGGSDFTVFGVAAMTVNFNDDVGDPQFQVVPADYEAKVSTSGGNATETMLGPQQDTPPSPIDVPRPPLTNTQLEAVVEAAFASCTATSSPMPPPTCPASDSGAADQHVTGRWSLNGDPWVNSSVTYDNTSGLLHVVGSYSLSFAYTTTDGTSQTDPYMGNYDAQIADNAGTPVLLTLVASNS